VQTANITVLVTVLIATMWYERKRARAGLWAGLAVGVKLFAWPVLVWLAATRRWRALGIALGVQAVGILITLPYLSVGDRISKGQILCIIEAMKIMNEIESEFDGVVKEILAQNAHPVEYGQVLFRIDPNG
jgi:multidrug efflux pump subunit AcrA (membrane-fusion protein)